MLHRGDRVRAQRDLGNLFSVRVLRNTEGTVVEAYESWSWYNLVSTYEVRFSDISIGNLTDHDIAPLGTFLQVLPASTRRAARPIMRARRCLQKVVGQYRL